MNEKKTDQITQLPVCDLHPFSNHPFHPYPEELMADLCRSIEENGIITPIIVRAVSKGTGYEIIAGHNRVEACRRIGMETIPAIVREVDTDTAILMMVDSNQQREHLLPSEKAFAYKMKLEAMKRQVKKNGARTQVGYRPGERSADLLGKEIGESRNQIQRYIRLTSLIPQLLELVDKGKLAMNPAVELSYLSSQQQEQVLTAMQSEQSSPSLAQARQLKERASTDAFTEDTPLEIMISGKGKRKEVFGIPMEKIAPFFPPDATPSQMEAVIVKLIEAWSRKQEKKKARDDGAR